MNLDNDLPTGRLLANVCRLQATRADQLMEQIGLFRGQALLLITLSEQDGLAHSEIAERLRISPSAATKVIKRLEALRYLQRQPDPTDERVSRVYLLPDGRAVIAQILAAFGKINQMILTGISPTEQAQLRELLRRMQVNLEEQG